MKTNSQIVNNLPVESTEAKPELTTGNTMKETTGEHPKTFSAADMWNIHRQRRTFIVR